MSGNNHHVLQFRNLLFRGYFGDDKSLKRMLYFKTEAKMLEGFLDWILQWETRTGVISPPSLVAEKVMQELDVAKSISHI